MSRALAQTERRVGSRVRVMAWFEPSMGPKLPDLGLGSGEGSELTRVRIRVRVRVRVKGQS